MLQHREFGPRRPIRRGAEPLRLARHAVSVGHPGDRLPARRAVFVNIDLHPRWPVEPDVSSARGKGDGQHR